DDGLVLHALVLAAQALVVLDRAEDARAEQPVALGLERAIVDRLRLLDLAVGPRENLVRARDRDPDLVEDLRRYLRAEKIHYFLVHSSSPGMPAANRQQHRMSRCHSRAARRAGPDSLITPPLPIRPAACAPAWNCAGRH